MKSARETKFQAKRRNWLGGFSPVGKAKGENQSLIFAQLCWILGRCHRFVLCSRTYSTFFMDSSMYHVSSRAYLCSIGKVQLYCTVHISLSSVRAVSDYCMYLKRRSPRNLFKTGPFSVFSVDGPNNQQLY